MFWDSVLYLCIQHLYKSASGGAVCSYNGLLPPKKKSLKAFVCFYFLILKEKNLKRENAYPWALKMNYFGICIGSVRLSTLELPNFLPQYSTPTHQHDGRPNSLRSHLFVSKNWTVFRAGLFHKNNSILEHQSYFIWLILWYF